MQSIEKSAPNDLWSSLKLVNHMRDANEILNNSFIAKVNALISERKNNSANKIECVDGLVVEVFKDVFNVYQAYLLSVKRLKKGQNDQKTNKTGKNIEANVRTISDSRLRFNVGNFIKDKKLVFCISDVEREVDKLLSEFRSTRNNNIQNGQKNKNSGLGIKDKFSNIFSKKQSDTSINWCDVNENNKLKSIEVFDYFVKQVAIFLRDLSNSENRLTLNVHDVIWLIHDFLDPSCYVDASKWLEKQINGNGSEDRILDFETSNNNSRISWSSFCEVMSRFENKNEFRMPLTSFSKFIKKDNNAQWDLDINKFNLLLNDYVYHTAVSTIEFFKSNNRYENKWLLSGILELKQNRIDFIKQIFESNCSFNISSTDELQNVINIVFSYLEPEYKKCKGEKLISTISNLKNSLSEFSIYNVLCALFKKINFDSKSKQKEANMDRQFMKSLIAVDYEIFSPLANKSGFEFEEKTAGDIIVPLGAISTNLVSDTMPQKNESVFLNPIETIKSKFGLFANLFITNQKRQEKIMSPAQKDFNIDVIERLPKMVKEMFNKFENMSQNMKESQSLNSWNEFVSTLEVFYKKHFERIYFNSHSSGPNIDYDVFMKLVKIALYCNQRLCLSSNIEKSETIRASMKHINLINIRILQQQRVNLSVKRNSINKQNKKADEIVENHIEFKDSLLLYIYANCLQQNNNFLLKNMEVPIDNLSKYFLSESLSTEIFDPKYIAFYLTEMENIDITEQIYCCVISFLVSAYHCKCSENLLDNKRRIIVKNKNRNLINTIVCALKCYIHADNVTDEDKLLSIDSVLEFCFREVSLSKDQKQKNEIESIARFYIEIINLLGDIKSFQKPSSAMESLYNVETCFYDFVSKFGLEYIELFTPAFNQINIQKQNIENDSLQELDLPTEEELNQAKISSLQQNSETNNVDNIVSPENLNHIASASNENIADIRLQQNFVSTVKKSKDDRNKAYLNMIQKFCDDKDAFEKFVETAGVKAEKELGVALKLCSELDRNIIVTEYRIKEFVNLFSLSSENQFDKTHTQEIGHCMENFVGKLIMYSKSPESEQLRNVNIMTQHFINDYLITFVWKDFFKNELAAEIKKRNDMTKSSNNRKETDNRHYFSVLEKIFSRNLASDSDNKEYILASDFTEIYNMTVSNNSTYESYNSLFSQSRSTKPESVKNMSELVFFDFKSSEQFQKFFSVLNDVYRSKNQNPYYPNNFSVGMDKFFHIVKNIIIDCYDNYPNVVYDIFSLDIFEKNSLSIDNLQIICDLVDIKHKDGRCMSNETKQNEKSLLDKIIGLLDLQINQSSEVKNKLNLTTFLRCLKLSDDRTVLENCLDWAIIKYDLVFDCFEFLDVISSEPNISYKSFSKYCAFSFPYLLPAFYDTEKIINPYADSNHYDIENPSLQLVKKSNGAQENGISDSKFVLEDKLQLLDLLWQTWHNRTLTEINNNFANVDVHELSSCYIYYLSFVLYYTEKFICSPENQPEDIKSVASFVQKVIATFVNEDAGKILNHCERLNTNTSSNKKLDFILDMMGIVTQYNNFFVENGFADIHIHLDVSKLIKTMSTLITLIGSVQGSWKNKLEKCFEWLDVMMSPDSLDAENIIEIIKLLFKNENNNSDPSVDNMENTLFCLLNRLVDLAKPEFRLDVVINFLDYGQKYCSDNLIEQLLRRLQGQQFKFDTIVQLIQKLDKSKLENVMIIKCILNMANKDDKLKVFDKLLESAQTFGIPLYRSFFDLLSDVIWSETGNVIIHFATINLEIISSLFSKFSVDSDTPKKSLVDLCLSVQKQDIKDADDVLRYIQTFLKTSGLKFESGDFGELVCLLFRDRSFCIDYENMVNVISVLAKNQKVLDGDLIEILKHCSAKSDKNCQCNLFLSLENFKDNTLKTQRSDIVELLCKIIEVTEKPFEVDLKQTNTNLQIMKIIANNNQALRNQQQTNVETSNSVLDCLIEKEVALSLDQLEYIFSYYFGNNTENNQELSTKLPLSLNDDAHQDLLKKVILLLNPDESNFEQKFNQKQKDDRSAQGGCANTLKSFLKKYFGVEKLQKTKVLDVIKKVDFSKIKKPSEAIKKLIIELWDFSVPFSIGELKKALSAVKSIPDKDKVEWDKIDKELSSIYFNEQIRSVCEQINNRNLSLYREDYSAIQGKLTSLRGHFKSNVNNSKTTYKLDKENNKNDIAKELCKFVGDNSGENTDITDVMLYLYLTHKKIQMQDKSDSEISDIVREVIDFGFISDTKDKLGYFENILDNLLIDENNQIQKISFNNSASVFYLIMEQLADNSIRCRDFVELIGGYFSEQERQQNIVIRLFSQSWKYIKRAFNNSSVADDKVLKMSDFEDKNKLENINFDQKDVLLISRKIKSRFLDFTTEGNKKGAEKFLSNCHFDHNDDKRFPSGDIDVILEKCKFKDTNALINFFNSHWDAGMLPTREQSVAWIGSAGLSDKNQDVINKFWRHTQELYLLNEIYKLSNGNVENDFFNPDFKDKFEGCGKVANELMSGNINLRDAKELYNQIGYKYKDANHEVSVTLLFNVMLLPYEIWVLNFVLFLASILLLVLLVTAGVVGAILLNALTVFVLCLNLALSAYFGIKIGKAVSFNCKKAIFEPEKTWFQNLCTKLLRRIFYKPNFNRENFSVLGYTAQLNHECQITNRQYNSDVPILVTEKNTERGNID